VAVAQLDMARTAERLVQGGLDLVRDVRIAYAGAILAEERTRLAAESRDARERIAAIADAQLRLGDISRSDA
jgi:cobalt-zinc-cadmium efflux system outer membrane protein